MSAPRLPVPGGDDGNWGNLLNTFLDVEHNTNGTLKKTALINGAEQTSRKGQVNGYAGLGSDGIVPTAQLPASLPGVGDYIGVFTGSIDTQTEAYASVEWATISASRGSSLSWDIATPYLVSVDVTGVYAIQLMVNWADEADTSGSYRWAQINAACGFYMQNRMASVNNIGTPVETVQTVQLTVYLQQGQDIFMAIEQGSAGTITPEVRGLVTRIA